MKAEKDQDQAELDLRIMKDINKMPTEVQDRFKAISSLYNQYDDITEEERVAARELELKYEKLYLAAYEKRAALLRGDEGAVDMSLVEKFNERAEIFNDTEAFPPVEMPHVEFRDIQNIPHGVPGFWLKSMLNNKEIAQEIFEKDRAILSYLQDIRLDLHEHDYGFALTFVFEKNSYFKQTELKKTFHCKH